MGRTRGGQDVTSGTTLSSIIGPRSTSPATKSNLRHRSAPTTNYPERTSGSRGKPTRGLPRLPRMWTDGKPTHGEMVPLPHQMGGSAAGMVAHWRCSYSQASVRYGFMTRWKSPAAVEYAKARGDTDLFPDDDPSDRGAPHPMIRARGWPPVPFPSTRGSSRAKACTPFHVDRARDVD